MDKILLNQINDFASTYVPNFIWAFFILFFGWIGASIIYAIVRKLLHKTTIDDQIAKWTLGEEKAEALEIERLVARVVYYISLLFVIVAFFEKLGFTLITGPLNQFLDQILLYAPKLLSAALLLGVAWIFASIGKLITERVLRTTQFIDRLSEKAGFKEEKESQTLAGMFGDLLYWLILILFLPAILDVLELKALLNPIQGMVNEIVAYFPNLLGAAALLFFGWFGARIIQRITSNVLAALGVDHVSRQIGLESLLGEKRLSEVLGTIIYIILLIPIIIAALDTLALDAITQPATNMLDKIMLALPNLFAAGLLLTVSYFVGRVVRDLTANFLTNAGFNNILLRLGIGEKPKAGEPLPSEIVGHLVLVMLMLFAGIEALNLLGFVLLAELVTQFTVFASHVILGLIVFGVGLYLANLASNTIKASSTHQAGLLALASRVSILTLAGAIALRQMGLANEIINLAFGLLLGAVAVAVALSFGLGGRDAASKLIEKFLKEIE